MASFNYVNCELDCTLSLTLKTLHKKTHDKKLAYKLNALVLLEMGYTYEEAAEALLVNEKTVRR